MRGTSTCHMDLWMISVVPGQEATETSSKSHDDHMAINMVYGIISFKRYTYHIWYNIYIYMYRYIYIHINICNINISTPSTSPQHTLKLNSPSPERCLWFAQFVHPSNRCTTSRPSRNEGMNMDQRWRVIRSLKLTASPRKLVVGRLHKISMWLSCEYCIKRATGQSCGIGIQQEHLFILCSSVDGHKRD